MILLILRDVDTATTECRILSPHIPRVGERIITETKIFEVLKIEYVVRDEDWLYTRIGGYGRNIQGIKYIQIDAKKVKP